MHQQKDSNYMKRSYLGGVRLFAVALLMALTASLLPSASSASDALYVVSPEKPDIIAMQPFYRKVQSSTEIDTFPPPAPPGSKGENDSFTFRGGVDTWINNRVNSVDIPLACSYGRIISLQADLPFITFNHSSAGGDTTDTGIGDVLLTLKLKGDILEDIELYHLISVVFPTGDKDRGLGNGTYYYSYTQKLSTMIAGYRATFMAGVSIPKPGYDIDVEGSVVTRQPTVSWMAAAERKSAAYTGVTYSLSLTGMRAFHSRVDGKAQKNDLTTMDVVPGIRYDLSPTTALTGSLGIPLLTLYDLPGARNERNPFLSLGVTRSF